MLTQLAGIEILVCGALWIFSGRPLKPLDWLGFTQLLLMLLSFGVLAATRAADTGAGIAVGELLIVLWLA